MSLHDLLEDLATEAPAGGAIPRELWERGRRVARAQRLGAVVIVATACLTLLALAGMSWQRGAGPSPASGHRAPAMPDRLYEPSGWLPSYDGAPGVLAAVLPTVRKTLFGSEPGVVGVSAVSGRYAFLKLPHLTATLAPEVVLSPDGTKVGYWLTGRPSQRAYQDTPVIGFAVYDATTGRTRQHRVHTSHGLEPNGLAWADTDVLYAVYSQVRSPRMREGSFVGVDGMRPPTGRVRAALTGWGSYPVGWGRMLVESPATKRHPATSSLVDLATGKETPVALPGELMPVPAVSPRGQLIAALLGHATPGPMTVSEIGGATLLTRDEVSTPLAWIDDEHLAADGYDGLEILDVGAPGRAAAPPRVAVRGFPGGNADLQRFAYGLLLRPTLHAAGPPSPWSPRVELGAGAGIVVVAAVALVLWRRRVRL